MIFFNRSMGPCWRTSKYRIAKHGPESDAYIWAWGRELRWVSFECLCPFRGSLCSKNLNRKVRQANCPGSIKRLRMPGVRTRCCGNLRNHPTSHRVFGQGFQLGSWPWARKSKGQVLSMEFGCFCCVPTTGGEVGGKCVEFEAWEDRGV